MASFSDFRRAAAMLGYTYDNAAEDLSAAAEDLTASTEEFEQSQSQLQFDD